MSVLAGALELVFFNFNNIMQGHPDHEKVIAEFERLADLAAFVREHPVIGIPAYKPPNSDPGGDMYIMDFLGMLGIPLVPVHKFPENAPIIFLPAQAASDPYLLNHVNKAHARGAYLIVTTSLLIALPDSEELTRLLGISPKIKSEPIRARLLSFSQKTQKFENTNVMIDLESPIEFNPKPTDVVCTAGGKMIILLSVTETPNDRIALLNTHTYNQADFDAVREVLLCPRPLGLLDMDEPALAAFRAVFGNRVITDNNKTIMKKPLIPFIEGPGCVTIHTFKNGNCVVQNFNDEEVRVEVSIPIQENKSSRFIDGFTGKPVLARINDSKNTLRLSLLIPKRGRVWVRRVDFAVKDN
jgi:hypothetical protein